MAVAYSFFSYNGQLTVPRTAVSTMARSAYSALGISFWSFGQAPQLLTSKVTSFVRCFFIIATGQQRKVFNGRKGRLKIVVFISGCVNFCLAVSHFVFFVSWSVPFWLRILIHYAIFFCNSSTHTTQKMNIPMEDDADFATSSSDGDLPAKKSWGCCWTD